MHESNPDSWRKLETLIQGMGKLEGRVGWFEKSRYETGEYVAQVAAQNEYGNPSKRIPARPFMRPTIIEKQASWKSLAKKLSVRMLESDLKPFDAMSMIAIQASNDISKKIRSIYEPELSPATIARRLSRYKDKSKIGNLTKPLIDTGHMISTLTYEVRRT